MHGIVFEKIEYGSKQYKESLDIRNRVLRIPLGLDIYDEDLKGEKNDKHIAAFFSGRLAAVLVLTDLGEGRARMRQVAVDEGLRSRGIGKKLIAHAERLLESEGYKEIVLHSRMTSKDFYLKLGYEVTSDVFTEVMIPHVEMKKHL